MEIPTAELGRNSATADCGRGPSIVTYSGRYFYPWAPREDDVAIEDIAHALAYSSRFNGHLREYYSIAQHSVIGSYYVPVEHALAFLFHDAHEAYLGDHIGPLKYGYAEPVKQALRSLEERVQAAIDRKFLVSRDAIGAQHHIKTIDLRMLAGEMMRFGHPSASAVGGWVTVMRANGIEPVDGWGLFEAWEPKRAEREFRNRFTELTEHRK